MDPETAKTLSVLVMLSYNIFNVFGKSGNAIGDVFNSFKNVLASYPEKKIIYGFEQWMQEKSVMPTPADIIKIIREFDPPRRYSAPEHRVLLEHEKYKPPSAEDKAAVSKIVADLMARQAPKDRPDPGPQNYKHFNSMPSEAQDEVKNSFLNSVKRMRESV